MKSFCGIVLGVAASITLFVHAASAGSTIDVGQHKLLPNQDGQIIELLITGDDLVRGFNLRAQLGDGLAADVEPIFSAVDFSGGIWDVHASTTLGGPVVTASQFAQASVDFSEPGHTVVSNGQLVRLTLSTVGLTSGEFFLRLASTDIDEDSDLILPGGGTLQPEIRNGGVIIIPEPTTEALCVLGFVLAWLGLRVNVRKP